MRIIIVTVGVALLTFLAFSWPGVAAAPDQLADGLEQSNSPFPAPTGRLLVKFKPDAASESRASVLSQAGAEPAGKVRGLGISVVQVSSERTAESLRALNADPGVEFAEIDYERSVATQTTPWGVEQVGADEVWPSYRGAGVVVAVVDTGVQLDHPDLADNIESNGRDFVNGDFYAYDDEGHGTAVAGVVAAVDNTVGLIGVAPDAKILPVKVLDEYGSGYDSDIANGIMWAADQGAQVINLSLSGLGSSTTLAAAVEYAESHGSLVVAAAGNSGWYLPEYPAAYPDVVSVGALDSLNGVASWSSWGKVDVAAPGVDIESTALGNTYSADNDGTSFAAPHVAGVAALLAEQYPGATPAQLRQLLLGTATDVGMPVPDGVNDLESGAGLVDAVTASTAAVSLLSLHGDETPSTELGPFGPRGLRQQRSGVTDKLDVLAGVSNPDGSPIEGDELTFAATGGNITATSATTDADGVGLTTASSNQKGRMQVSVDSIGQDLHGVFEIRVAEENDEIPGRNPPSNTKFTNSLHERTDVADVWAMSLKAGETLEAKLSGAGGTEFFLCLYPPGSASLFESLPKKCSGGSGYPQSLNWKVPSGQGGKWYLAAFSLLGGSGTYTISWAVKVPGVITPLAVTNKYFSPNGDGVKDVAKITFNTNRSGTLRLDIYNPSGRQIKFQTLGVKGPGKYTFKWGGKNKSGTIAANGKFTAVVKWSTAPRYSQRETALIIDTIPPSLSSLTDTPDPFYPKSDGYRDYSHIKYNLRERAQLDLRISPKGRKTTIRHIVVGWRPKGQGQVNWDGRKGDGSLVWAGVFEYRFKMTDEAGNKKWTGRKPVTVSLKKLVTKSKTMTKDAISTYVREADSCGFVSPDSYYYRGIWLSILDCYSYDEGAMVGYRFKVPSAVRYDSISVSEYGSSLTGNHLFGFIWNWKTDEPDLLGYASAAEGWYTYPSKSASGRVRSDRTVDIEFLLMDEYMYGYNWYEIRDVRIEITYGVLK